MHSFQETMDLLTADMELKVVVASRHLITACSLVGMDIPTEDSSLSELRHDPNLLGSTSVQA